MQPFPAWLTQQMRARHWTPDQLARWTAAPPADVQAWLAGRAVPDLAQLRCLAGIAREDLIHVLAVAGWLRDAPLSSDAQTETP